MIAKPHLFQENPLIPSWEAQADSTLAQQGKFLPRHKAAMLPPKIILCCGRCIHIKLIDLVFILLCHHWSLQFHCWACGKDTTWDCNGGSATAGVILRHKSILDWSKPRGGFRACAHTLTSKLLFVIKNTSLSPMNRNSTTTLQPAIQPPE